MEAAAENKIKARRVEKVGLRTRESSIMYGPRQRCVGKINSIENGGTKREILRE